jgi:hypothetical protein
MPGLENVRVLASMGGKMRFLTTRPETSKSVRMLASTGEKLKPLKMQRRPKRLNR